MPATLRCSIGALLALVLLVGSTSAQEWTRFRGPNGAGQSDTVLPVAWTAADYNWQVKLPGIGHGSPVVWGDKVFIHSADPNDATRYVVCLSAADGSTLWTRKFASSPYHIHIRSSFASATPAVDADAVYLAWATPEKVTFIAFDHAGETLWERDLGPYVSMHGFGGSPMLYGDLVVLANMQQSEKLDPGKVPGVSFVIAVDRKTGATRWQASRDSSVASYTVPCVYEPAGGAPQLISCGTANGMFALDPTTGKELWSIDVFTMRTVSSPVVAGGLLFGSTGQGAGGNYVVAIKPGETPQLAYEVKQQAPYVPTAVAFDDALCLWSDKGVVTAIDAATGKMHWTQRVGGNYSGSPIRAGKAIYCISEEGEVVVIAARKDRYEELGRVNLGEDSRSTPAVSGGRMYLRTYSQLFSLGGKSS